MQLALITDIHADVHALSDALRQIDRLGCDLTVCAGDLVDWGLFPDETITLLQERGIPCVRGNHDRWAISGDAMSGGAELAPASRGFLRTLPSSWTQVIEGVRVAVHHGRPGDDMHGIYPDRATADDVRRWLDAARADVLIVGHTHRPFRLDLPGRGVIVNPGALLRDPAEPLDEPEFAGFSAAPGTFGVLDLPSLDFQVFTARGEAREPLRRVVESRD